MLVPLLDIGNWSLVCFVAALPWTWRKTAAIDPANGRAVEQNADQPSSESRER
jgi:hypothetical protein